MSQQEAAERERARRLQEKREKKPSIFTTVAPTAALGLVAVLVGAGLVGQIVGEDGYRAEVIQQVADLTDEANEGEAAALELTTASVKLAVGTDQTRYARDVAALDALLLGAEGAPQLGEAVDGAVLDAAADLIGAEPTGDKAEPVVLRTLITGVGEGTKAKPGTQSYRTSTELPSQGVSVVVYSTFTADGELVESRVLANEIVDTQEG